MVTRIPEVLNFDSPFDGGAREGGDPARRRLLREAQRTAVENDERRGEDRTDDRRPARIIGKAKEPTFESFEQLSRQPLEFLRYTRISESLKRLLPFLQNELVTGDATIEMRQRLSDLHQTETDGGKKRKIEAVLNAEPGSDKTALIRALIEEYKDDPRRKAVLEQLLRDETRRTNLAQKITALTRGEAAASLLSDVINNKRGLDKKGALSSLVDLVDSDADKQTLRAELGKLLIDEVLLAPESTGRLVLAQLRQLFSGDRDKSRAIDAISSGRWDNRATALRELREDLAAEPQTLLQLRDKLNQSNYRATRELLPIAADYLERGVTNNVIELGLKMLKGTRRDRNVPFPTHFFEGCPIQLPEVSAGDRRLPATWEGFLTRVAQGRERLTLPRSIDGLLTDGVKTALFVNATDWFSKSENTVARENQINLATLLNEKLKREFRDIPASWEMPPVTDTRRLDQWYKSASDVSNLMEMVTGYVQGYLDLEQLDPEIGRQTDANSAINALRSLGAVIEWNPVTRRLTRCNLPVPKDLNLRLPENDGVIAALRKWIGDHHGPVDRAAEAYATGRASWLRWGDFREPVARGQGEGGGDRKAVVVRDRDSRRLLRVENCMGTVVTIWHDGKMIHRNRAGKFIDQAGREVEEIPRTENEQKDEFDYIRHTFSVKKNGTDDRGQDRFEVSVERRYCREHALNLERWGSDIDALTDGELTTVAVGTESLNLRPGQRVVVQDSVTQKSRLWRPEDLTDGDGAWWRWRQKWLYHHGAKAGDVGLNVGLTVSGGGSIAAFRTVGLRAAAVGAFRAGLGASGLLEPALRAGVFDQQVRQLPGGNWNVEDVESLRHGLIMLDVFGLQAGGAALRLLRGGRSAEIGTAIGRWGRAGESASRWGHRSVLGGMALTGPVLGQQIYTDTRDRSGHFADRNGPLVLADRPMSWEDFRKANPEFKLSDPSARRVLRGILDTYADTLALGTENADVRTRVRTLFRDTKDVIGLRADDPRRQAVIARLIGCHHASGDEILLGRISSDPKYTDRANNADNSDLPDAEAQTNRQLATRLGRGSRLGDVSEPERIAAMQCLIMLSAREDGTLPESGVIASRDVQIAAHKMKATIRREGRDVEEWQSVAAGTVRQEVRIEDALQYLHRTASSSKSDLLRHVRALVSAEPHDPVNHLKTLLIALGERESDEQFSRRKVTAAQYLRRHLFLSTDDANKFADDLRSSDAETVRAAERALGRLFAERSPANKYLRQQLNLTLDQAQELLNKLNSSERAIKQRGESELRERCEVAINANRLVAADTLFWHGRYRGDYTRELMSICMDVLGNKNLPDALRIKAVLDRNSPRLGLLIGEVEGMDAALLRRPAEQLFSLLGSTYGATARDARALLLSVIMKDGDREVTENGRRTKPKEESDLRSACALALLANQQEKVEERRAFLGEIAQDWERLSANRGAFASHAVTLLRRGLEANIDTAPNGSEWRVRKDKLDAAVALLNLGKIELPRGTYKIDPEEFNRRLLESIAALPTRGRNLRLLLNPEHSELTLDALNSLNYAHLSLEQRRAVLDILSLPLQNERDPDRRRSKELAKLIVVKNIRELLNNGRGGTEYDALRQTARDKLLAMFNRESQTYAGLCPELRVAVVTALKDLNWRDVGMRQFMEERLMPATRNGRADGPVIRDGNGRIVFVEPHPGVRAAALEALYQMNPDDPGARATGHRDVEHDALAGRIAQALEARRQRRRPGDAREQSEITQRLELRLLNPSQCSTEPGQRYIRDSRYKNLIELNLSDSMAAALSSVYGRDFRGTFQQGFAETNTWPFSLAVGMDRLSGWSTPTRKYEARVETFLEEYSRLSTDLCNEAIGVASRDVELSAAQKEAQQRRAIGAMVWFLNDNCEKCREADRKIIRGNFAAALALLCGREFKVPGQERPITVSSPVRRLAYSHVRNLITNPSIKADVQLHLVDALHRLNRDGAVDDAVVADLAVTMLGAPIRNQNVRRPADEDYEDFKQVQIKLLNDLLRHRTRHPNAIATIIACAGGEDGRGPGHPIQEVKDRARVIMGLLTNGVTLTREDIRFAPDIGSTPIQRADRLRNALRAPARHDDNIVSEIFQAVTGNPITQPDDPRLPTLLQIAANPRSPRVKAALGHALLDVGTPDGRAALLGLSLLNEIQRTDRTVLSQEATERLSLLGQSAQGMEIYALLLQDSRAREQSVLRNFWEYSNVRSAGDARERTDALARLVRADIDEGKDNENYTRQLAAAWGANGFDIDNPELIGACRLILAHSRNEQAKLAAAYAISKSAHAPAIDKQQALTVLRHAQTNGSTEVVKADAAQMLNPRLEEAARARFDTFLQKIVRLRSSIADWPTRGELDRANEDTLRQYIEIARTNRIAREVQIEQLRSRQAALVGEGERLEAQLVRLRRMAREGVCELFQSVERTTDASMPIADRIARFNQALRTPGANNDDLVRAVFQMTAGSPIANANDPRLPLLARLGYTHIDTRVEEAVGFTLFRTNLPDVRSAGAWMLADVKVRGNEGQRYECTGIFDHVAAAGARQRQAIADLQRNTVARTHGALLTIFDSDRGIARQERLTNNNAIREKITFLERALADQNLPGRLKVQALADAWSVGDFKDPTGTLLPLTRRLATGIGTNEQVQMAALYLMIKAGNLLDLNDRGIIWRGLEQLSTSASNPTIKQEASMMLDQLRRGSDEVRAFRERMTALNAANTAVQAEMGRVEQEARALDAAIRRRTAELEEERQMQRDGINKSRVEFNRTGDARMSVADRLKALDTALKNRGVNNENLVRAIFQLAIGNPITNNQDSRLTALYRLGHSEADTRVLQAVAITLVHDVRLPNNSAENAETVLWILADVVARGKRGQVREARELLGRIDVRAENLGRSLLELKFDSVWDIFKEADSGRTKQETINDRNEIRSKVTRAESALADNAIPIRLKLRWLFEAAAAGDYRDPTGTLLPVIRRILRNSNDDHVRFAAVLCGVAMNREAPLARADLDVVKRALKDLTTRQGNRTVMAEARRVANALRRAGWVLD